MIVASKGLGTRSSSEMIEGSGPPQIKSIRLPVRNNTVEKKHHKYVQ